MEVIWPLCWNSNKLPMKIDGLRIVQTPSPDNVFQGWESDG